MQPETSLDTQPGRSPGSSSAPTAAPGRPSGRVLTAMVTPFTPDRELDLDAAQKLALIRTFFLAGNVAFGKAALRLAGLEVGDPRLPQLPAESDHVTAIAAALVEAGVLA